MGPRTWFLAAFRAMRASCFSLVVVAAAAPPLSHPPPNLTPDLNLNSTRNLNPAHTHQTPPLAQSPFLSLAAASPPPPQSPFPFSVMYQSTNNNYKTKMHVDQIESWRCICIFPVPNKKGSL